jgi:HlyD family secretion protein
MGKRFFIGIVALGARFSDACVILHNFSCNRWLARGGASCTMSSKLGRFATEAANTIFRRADPVTTIRRGGADGCASTARFYVRAGEPVFVIEDTGKQWLSFNVREDQLHGLTVGTSVDVARTGTADLTRSVATEMVPLGTFATWQAERAIGDHDRNTLRLRLDPQDDAGAFEPGMTVWLNH